MKGLSAVLGVITVAVLLTGAPASVVKASSNATITVLNPPPSGLLELEVAESYTLDIEITSDVPFVVAMAMTDAYW